MRRRIGWIVALLLCSAVPARAHPGTGIVVDGRGNVFYTDLARVWRIAPDGTRSVAVPDVHTHDLGLDAAGNLLGEDSEYLGGDRFRSRVWRRTPAGRVEEVMPWRQGSRSEFGFTRDARGNSYWPHCAERRCQIRARGPDGRTRTLAPGVPLTRNVQIINWMAATPAGAVYFPDGRDLRRLDPDGRVVTVVAGLAPRPAEGGASELHSIFGIWADPRGDVYVANLAGRAVQRVTAAGAVTLVARSPAPWGPTGVTRAPNGDLWVLEYSSSNEARVRRIRPTGEVATF